MVDFPIPASPEMTKTPPKGPGDDSLLPGEPPPLPVSRSIISSSRLLVSTRMRGAAPAIAGLFAFVFLGEPLSPLAIIGLSVVYKALDNMGAYQRWFGFQPNTKAATLIFGFCHGFGLSSKILDYDISPDGLLPNLLAFNVGVEVGQLLALGAILIVMGYWRRTPSFLKHAYTANVLMMTAGFILIGYQLTGYFVTA